VREWIHNNLEAFERDVLRDFCRVSISLGEQFLRHAETGTVSFSVLQDLVGEPMNKGSLWRLKDKAHHVFLQKDSPRSPVGPLLDWTMGYMFHESLKLMEDAHQRQYYRPRIVGGMGEACESLLVEITAELNDIRGQTQESMRREVERLRKLIDLSRKLFAIYFAGCRSHKPLARLLNDEQSSVRRAFQNEFSTLLAAVYGREIERMYVQAAQSLLDSARPEAAARAVADALKCNPHCPEALALQASLQSPDNMFL
jgi:hypothetical protein